MVSQDWLRRLFLQCNGIISPNSDTASSRNSIDRQHSRVPERNMSDFLGCEVCAKIITVFRTAISQDDHIIYELGKLSDVITMPCPHAASIRKLWESGRQYMHGTSTTEPWSVQTSYSHSEPVMIRFVNGEQILSYDVDLVANDGPEHPGTSTLPDSQWIDPFIPRHWYSKCLHEHGSQCERPSWMDLHPGINADPDWLIDVIDQCIVPFSSDTSSYLTLSYTWGNVQCLKTNTGNLRRLKEPGSIHSRQALNIPQTVRDAMGVTEYLGERYLWVDSLCIIQDDQDSLSRHLSSMHRIYANSALCLVAYGGTDANHGLRGLHGVTAPRRLEQITLDIAGGERLSYFNIPHIFSGPTKDADHDAEPTDDTPSYNRRGWTYQEFIFAKRRLVFTDGPLRWLCDKVQLGEEKRDFVYRRSWTYPMAYTFWMNNRLPSLILLGRIIYDYNMRQFTFESDVLRAFLGIQNHLEGVFYGGLNYGHPDMFLDISLAWEAVGGVTRRGASAEVHHEYDDLPSWSWMGWSGDFSFPGDAEYCSLFGKNGFTEPVADWFSMESPSSSLSNMRPVYCKWHHYKTLFESNPSQVPDGWEVYTTTWGSVRVKSESRKIGSKYPVPILSCTDIIQSIPQRRYLFAKTSRCHFATRSAVLLTSEDKALTRFYIELCSPNGEFVGYLRLHHLAEIDRLHACGTVELVAVAKGWTTKLSDFLLAHKEQDKIMATRSTTPASQHFPPESSPIGKTKHICYFVLCIQWENGIAKRQASGKVFAEDWEKYQEPVDLILG